MGAWLLSLTEGEDRDGKLSAYHPSGPVPRAIEDMKSAVPDLLVMTDVCIDAYTDHGHCGVLKASARGVLDADAPVLVDNDATLDVLAPAWRSFTRRRAPMWVAAKRHDGGRTRRAPAEGFGRRGVQRDGDSVLRRQVRVRLGPFREAAECAPKHRGQCHLQMGFRRTNTKHCASRVSTRKRARTCDDFTSALPYLDVLTRIRRTRPRFRSGHTT